MKREVAFTFDDIPGSAMLRRHRCDARAFAEMNRTLVRKLSAQGIPATAFVNEGHLCERDRSALPGILRIWANAGFELGNHSFSHLDLNTTPLARYQSDVIRGETVVNAVLRQKGTRVRYFRHPFLHAGKDLATKRAFETFLARRGYTVAPVTIDNQEWIFAEVYAMAKTRGDTATASHVAREYVRYMEVIFDFFEKRSVEVVGYEIPQVLLLHANPLNADHLDALVSMIRRRGYAFITLERALQEPAYRLRDTYAGPRGLSWLHRWGTTKGIRMREEPREPEFVARYFKGGA